MKRTAKTPLLRGLRRLFITGILLLMAFSGFSSHFRYGNITWQRVPGNPLQIKFTITQAWRSTFYVGTPSGISVGAVQPTGYIFDPGDGSGGTPINITVTSVNVAEDWFYGTFTYTATYAANGTYNAFFTSCCRLSSLQNNADQEFYINSTVTVGNSNDAPVSTLPPYINLPTGAAAATYQLPATDPNGDALTYTLTPAGSFGFGTVQPGGLSISSSGLLTFNTVGKAIGNLYNTNITVTDSKGATIMLDFLIKITGQSTPPFFDYPPTPPNSTAYLIQPGQNLSFTVKAEDNDVGDIVGLSGVGLPSGATFAPSSGNPTQSVFSWTPTSGQLGTYLLNFIAQDAAGIQTSTLVRIDVSLKPTFDVPQSPGNGSLFCVVPGTTVTNTFQASDPDPQDSVQLSVASGQQAGMSFAPALPTAYHNPVSTILTYVTAGTDWGIKRLVMKATDSYGETALDSVYYIVDHHPTITSTPTLNVIAGQSYSYLVTTADLDIPQGDHVELESAVLPPFLSIVDNGNGTFTVSGTPSVADSGNHNITIEAEDSLNHFNGTHCGNVTQTFVLHVSPCNITTSKVVTSNTCYGDSLGTITMTVNNAASPVTYMWNGATSTKNRTNLPAGTYYLAITDANGCHAYDTAMVTQAAPILIAVVQNNVTTCSNGNNGSLQTTASNGFAPYTYSWSNGSTNKNISNLTAGTYKLTVTDAHGCKMKATYVITAPAPVAIAADVNNVSCYGQCNGSIDITASGGTPPYTYYWSNAWWWCNNMEDRTNLCPGTYCLTVTDAHGCSKSATYTITQPSPICVSVVKTNLTCNGSNNGALNISVTGGTAPYTYHWSNNATTQDITGLAAGNYTVTVTDANGCTYCATYSVTQPSAISACINVSNGSGGCGSSCANGDPNTIYIGYGPQCLTLTASVSGSGYTYSWSPSAGISNPGSSCISVCPTTPTTYTCTISKNGCSVTKSVFINVINVQGPNGKIIICHHTNSCGNSTTQTMYVYPSQVAAHLCHGDDLGPCDGGGGTPQPKSANGGSGIGEEEGIVVFNVYPNPTNGSFNIDVPDMAGSTSVVVRDINGRAVETRTIDSHQPQVLHFDFKEHAKGIYLIDISNNNDHYQSKILLQ